ncbi:glycosyltransferase family 2 protein [Arthrobacter gandavensis]|nr:glycosyltransferase family 2 protein [Arthrobacter gandavensis]
MISYVFPVYNEAGTIPRLYEELCLTVDGLEYEIEIVFVNDGSTDSSLDALEKLRALDDRVVIVDLARNYGQQVAVSAGLDNASGDAVIIMDSDLQDPPAVSLSLIEKWEEGFDVAYAQRRTRKDPWFKQATATVFYRVLQKLADIDIPRNTGDFRLLDRRVVEELRKFNEKSRFIRGMVSYVGFNQVAVPFDRHERYAGTTNYPVKKLMKLASDAILGFSTFPLTLISRLGYAVALMAVVGVFYVLIQKVYFPEVLVAGWAFIVISVLFVGGLQLIMLGVLGSYIGRIYRQVQDRPLYGLRAIHSARSPLVAKGSFENG